MRFGISCNPEIGERIAVAERIVGYLEPDHEVLLDENLAKKIGGKGSPLEDIDADVLLAIGGDGTILSTLQRNSSPIFGINAGVLGFLTEIQVDEIESGLQKIIEGNYEIDERLKLRTTVNGKRVPDCTNEAVLNTAHIAKMRAFSIEVDGQPAESIRADAVIIATPTGSTCYAMSAGGPIIDPRVEAIVVVPIAPFKLSVRPVIVPAQSEITLRISDPKPCKLVLDGQVEIDLVGDEVVKLGVSEYKAKFVRFHEDFYTRIREKLTVQ
ncbi:MAG: NAD(+)/NADH kinase [Thermoplasmata archaeon]